MKSMKNVSARFPVLPEFTKTGLIQRDDMMKTFLFFKYWLLIFHHMPKVGCDFSFLKEGTRHN